MATNSGLSRLLVFWPGKPWNAGLFFSMAKKATLLWPGLPQNPGLDQAYQAFPRHAFLASPAKTLAILAWPGLLCFWPRSWCKGCKHVIYKRGFKKWKTDTEIGTHKIQMKFNRFFNLHSGVAMSQIQRAAAFMKETIIFFKSVFNYTALGLSLMGLVS